MREKWKTHIPQAISEILQGNYKVWYEEEFLRDAELRGDECQLRRHAALSDLKGADLYEFFSESSKKLQTYFDGLPEEPGSQAKRSNDLDERWCKQIERYKQELAYTP